MKLNYFVCALLCATLGFSCTNTDDELDTTSLAASAQLQTPPPYAPSVAQDKAFIAQLGYDTLTLVEYPEYYQVEGEFVFEKDALHEVLSKPQPRMKYGDLVNEENRRIYLTVYSSDASGNSALDAAVDEWNKIENCSINFQNGRFGPNVTNRTDVPVFFGDKPEGKTGLLTVVANPTIGMPCSRILINTAHPIWANLGIQQQYLLMHALGHVVKLENYDSGRPHYPGTIDDSFTIMQSEQLLTGSNMLWSGFTSADKHDIPVIYPRPAAVSTIDYLPKEEGMQPNQVKAGNQYTITTSYTYAWAVDPQYTFSMRNTTTNTECRTDKTESNACTVTFPSAGNYELTVTVNEKCGEVFTYKKTFECVATKPVFDRYPRTIEIGQFYDFKVSCPNPNDHPTFTFAVKEDFFDNGSDRSVTIENVSNGHVRIRFNEYGSYTITATMTSGATTAFVSCAFTRLLKPNYTWTILSERRNPTPPVLMGDPTTAPTGFNWIALYPGVLTFDTTAPLTGRVILNADLYYLQNAFILRRVDHREVLDKSVSFIAEKGAAPRIECPAYQMYHPDSLNYESHYTMCYQHYENIKYPNEAAPHVY